MFKLKYNKDLPNYTKGEEIFNAVSHIVGGVFGIVALVVGVVFACLYSDSYGVVSMAIYGSSMILLYTMSAIYHFLRRNKAKKIFRIFDHCTIFLLIAGTYTPFTLVSLRGTVGWTIFGIIWGAAALGIVLNAIDLKSTKVFSMICYLLMGWCIIFKFDLFLASTHINGVILMAAGGVAYTIGAILYGIGKKKNTAA